MAFVKVADVGELARDSVIEIMVGNRPLAVCNIRGTIHALDGMCPQSGGPLGQGTVNGNSVTCPWHDWDFDCVTGENSLQPEERVEVFGVRVSDGAILVDLPLMPELPEVETVVRSLIPQVTGRRIQNVEFGKRRVWKSDPEEAARVLPGRTIESVERYGKYIVFRLAPDGFLIVHLGMTGKLLWNSEPAKHTHAIFTLDVGTLFYNDSRQFGRVLWSQELPAGVRKLGPEPLLVTFERFAALLKQRKSRVKALLLNQEFVRGMGNIYADEALFRAGIHPLALGFRLRNDRARLLYESMREVLREAIEQKGSSISDYVDSDGNRGSFQTLHRVYRRTGEPCLSCGSAIKRILVGQRGTHFCAKCQKR